jgi:hypothetical protein
MFSREDVIDIAIRLARLVAFRTGYQITDDELMRLVVDTDARLRVGDRLTGSTFTQRAEAAKRPSGIVAAVRPFIPREEPE